MQVQQTHTKAKYLLGLTEERPGPDLAANMTRYGMGQVRRLMCTLEAFEHAICQQQKVSHQHHTPILAAGITWAAYV